MLRSCRRPLVGVGAVPLAESHVDCVMFVCGQNRDGAITPIGTAFLIGFENEHGTASCYFVTAGHVVRPDLQVAEHPQTWVRLRRRDDGPPDDLPVGEWTHHRRADIAATPCDMDTSPYYANWQEEEYFCDKWPPGTSILLGSRAYFMGLLGHIETMAERAVPMMRAATVGAMNVEDVPVLDRRPDQTVFTRYEPHAHLIDCYSRSGFSGSPVYVEHPVVRQHEFPNNAIALEVWSLVALFGVLIGHFGSPGDNAGIGIVVPIAELRELLDDQRLVDWRHSTSTK